MGYFIVLICQFIVSLPIFLFMGCVAPMGLGCFLFALSFAKDWQCALFTLDELGKTKQSKLDVIKHVNEFVRSYSEVKKLS